MIDLGTHNVLGIRIAAVDYEAAVERIASCAQRHAALGVSALAVHGVMTGVLDRRHRYRLNRLQMLVPDGQPVRWALRWLRGLKLPDRVYGPTLMLKTCERAARDGLPIFLFGGSEPLLDNLASNLSQQFPQLQIAGRRASQFRRLSEDEHGELMAEIRDSGAKITFVGLGCPRQEVWTYESFEALSMPVLAVGAAFNFHAGVLPQAPAFFQSRGLEWAYRLFREPKRLWRRYLFLNPLYVSLLFLQWTRLRTIDPDDASRPMEKVCYG